ncbi:MAG TPA: DUF2652 domain-containing protein [Candidatus Sulfotelmatobacter sp.]|nr:DUF2652 domain-containing protein [Candidatus Sulfotelmatobacter sp.]
MADEVDAHILLADISGYTSFLKANTVTLRHATQIVSSLLEAVMAAAEGPVHANKVEGDAVLFVAPADGGSDAADRASWRSIGRFFQAFYVRRAELEAENTCPCEACLGLGRLNLKVISHHGRLLRHKVRRFEEVSGFDLVIAHRLLKNQVEGSRYLLSSETAWRRYGAPVDGVRHVEDCEGVGEVPVVVVHDAAALLTEVLPPIKATLGRRLQDWWKKHVVLVPVLGPHLMTREARHLHGYCKH